VTIVAVLSAHVACANALGLVSDDNVRFSDLEAGSDSMSASDGSGADGAQEGARPPPGRDGSAGDASLLPCDGGALQMFANVDTASVQVPDNCGHAKIEAVGGNGGSCAQAAGGLGADVIAEIPVTPGEMLTIFVGGSGAGASMNTNAGGLGGTNGGAAIGGQSAAGGGGGGSSEVSQCPANTTLGLGSTCSTRWVIAGGGGGCGVGPVGAGGGNSGMVGSAGAPVNSATGGGGASQTDGGAAGTGVVSGMGGTGMVGGDAYYGAGAGGGGFYSGGSGGSGSASAAGGGGGSSWIHPAAVGNYGTSTDAGAGAGFVTLEWLD
jgi:hypothetical protein